MKIKFLFVGILLFFLLTRLYRINEIPISLYWDEASIGYNAYSVLLTGKDEWNNVLPLHFRAFGEFKLPVYIYSVVAAEKLFGLSTLSVRLPSVIFSLGTILLLCFITLKICNKKSIALFSSFFLSISSWFFIFSRTGYEATAGLMFFLLGIYLFLFINKNLLFIIFSVISFIASIYSYNSFRIIVPITLFILIIFFWKSFTKDLFKTAMIGLCALLLLILAIVPIFRLIYFDAGLNRFQAVSLNGTGSSQNRIIAISKNYISHFSPNFLFISGDKNFRSQQKDFGQMYWIELPLFLLGLLFIFRQKKIIYWLPLVLILISPLPAAITKESPHALRAISMVPFIALICAFGVGFIAEKIKWRNYFYILVICLFLLFFGNYFKNFLDSYSNYSASDWQYGYKQIFQSYKDKFDKYDYIFISDYFGQPYIFALYYLNYNPEQFISSVQYNSIDKWGFSKVRSFDKFIFSNIVLTNLIPGKYLIFASVPEKEKLKNMNEKEIIRNFDGSIAFYVYEYQK